MMGENQMEAHHAFFDYEVQTQAVWNQGGMTERPGRLAYRNPPVVIMEYDRADRFIAVMEASLSNTHSNLLRSFVGDGERHCVMYENYSMPLDQYIDGLRQAEEFNLREVPYFGLRRYVHPYVRNIIRSVLKVIRSLHEAGRSLNGFVVDDIVMVDNDPKFIGIDLQNLNRNAQNQDYRSVMRLIDRIYGQLDIPAELSRLKDDLSRWSDRGDLIHDHASLWEPQKRNKFLTNIRDDLDFLTPLQKHDFFRAIGSLNLPWYGQLVHWNERIAPNTPLRAVYEDPSYVHTYTRRRMQLVRFMGNAVAHLSPRSTNGTLFKKKDIDKMLTAAFPSVVLELQRCLFNCQLSRFWKE